MDSRDEVFQPEIIDEQIEHLMLIQHPSQQATTPGARTIAEIQQMYQERTSVLENAWARIDSHAATHQALGEPVQITSYQETKQMQKQMLPLETPITNSDTQSLPGQQPTRSRPPRKRWRRAIELGLVAAVILATIFGWGFFSQTFHQKQGSSLASTPRPAQTGAPRCTFPLNPSSAFLGISWSSRGQIAVGLSTAQVMIFDAATCQQTVTFALPDALVNASTSWSPDGQRLAVSSVSSSEVAILNGATGTMLATYRSQPGTNAQTNSGNSTTLRVGYSSWSPDGHTIASTVIPLFGKTTGIQLWDASTGQHLRTLPLSTFGGKTFWSPDGRYLLAVGVSNLWIWETQNWQRIATYSSPDMLGPQVAWSPDGQHVAVALALTDEVRVWNTRTGQVTRTFHTQQSHVGAIGWSSDGRSIATATRDVRLWNAQTGQLISTYHYNSTLSNYPISTTTGLAWSPNSKMLVALGRTGTNDGRQTPQDRNTISIWNIA